MRASNGNGIREEVMKQNNVNLTKNKERVVWINENEGEGDG